MKLRSVFVLCLLLPLSAAAEIPDPDNWYRSSYAVLWTGKPGEQVEAMLTHYAGTVVSHREDGSVTSTPKRQWLVEPLQQWLAEGWLDSSLKTLRTDRINPTTASFKASWIDRYADAPDDVSCGWYLADWIEGRWQFTAYADIDCAGHGL